MIQICAWCQQEGKLGVLGVLESTGEDSDTQQSHGICPYHVLRLKRTYRRSLPPRTNPALLHHSSRISHPS